MPILSVEKHKEKVHTIVSYYNYYQISTSTKATYILVNHSTQDLILITTTSCFNFYDHNTAPVLLTFTLFFLKHGNGGGAGGRGGPGGKNIQFKKYIANTITGSFP